MSTTLLITNPVVSFKEQPTAFISVSPEVGVVGSVIRLDGRLSSDPGNNPLTHTWSFYQVPIGSLVALEPFRELSDDGSIVSFSPDIVGEYVLGLVVSNGVFDSPQATALTSVRSILVPNARGLVPDGKWIWSYIRDVWANVENKEWFEVLWSALIQIVGAELLKTYQIDFNKSIKDAQDLYQRRWQKYEPLLPIDQEGLTFILGNHLAGTDAYTNFQGLDAKAAIITTDTLFLSQGVAAGTESTLDILSSASPTNVGTFNVSSVDTKKGVVKVAASLNATADRITTGIIFTFSGQSQTWGVVGLPASVKVGDVVYLPLGLNAGVYTITSIGVSNITVDRRPTAASDGQAATIYRPVLLHLNSPQELLVDSVGIPTSIAGDLSFLLPGRVINVNGQTLTILRANTDLLQVTEANRIVLDRETVIGGQKSIPWRVPHTLISETQNFEELGVSSGDTLVVSIKSSTSATLVDVNLQIVGVDRNRVGVVLGTDMAVAGEIPVVAIETLYTLSVLFGIPAVTLAGSGSVTDQAAQVLEYIASGKFTTQYWNKELPAETVFDILGATFQVIPSKIIRNSLIPVDDELVSIPALQEFILQPIVSGHDGRTFLYIRNQEYSVKRTPAVLIENLDYVIDAEFAYDGDMSFVSGYSTVEVESGDFIDRGIKAGDVFSILSPSSMVFEASIVSVLSRDKLLLSAVTPIYSLDPDFVVSARVRITRGRKGKFLRLSQGLFSASNSAPQRLWAEVTLFDNDPNIENNFGILVGLSRKDLLAIESGINYRQAVAGLMYAYTKGTSIDNVRIGAHILLGLPFAESRGVIRSIEQDYRLDREGNPILGRIVIEDVGAKDVPTGLQRVYTFPVDPGSTIAGLETNPDTGEEYAVGDLVELFAPLCQGVSISDYLTLPVVDSTAKVALQKYHTAKLRVNDQFFTLGELNLVSSFLKKITPSYLKLLFVSTSEFWDTIDIVDSLSIRLPWGAMFDNPSGLPISMQYDDVEGGTARVFWDAPVYLILHHGTDLSSTIDAVHTDSAAGGLLNQRTNELFDSPKTQAGDLLQILSGPNIGVYTITSLSNTDIAINFVDRYGNPLTRNLATASNQPFRILRPIRHDKYVATDTVASQDYIEAAEGMRNWCVSPGDWAIFTYDDDTFFRTLVKSVAIGTGGKWTRINLLAAPTKTGEAGLCLVKPKLLPSYFGTVITTFSIVGNGTNLLTSADVLLRALLDIGDELVIQNPLDVTAHLVLSPTDLYAIPPVPTGTHTVKLKKKGRPLGELNFSNLERDIPADFLEMGPINTSADATCNSGSDLVSFTSVPNPSSFGILPGDLLVFTSTSNSTENIGYGPGVYPIVAISTTNVTLSRNLLHTGTASWKIKRRS